MAKWQKAGIAAAAAIAAFGAGVALRAPHAADPDDEVVAPAVRAAAKTASSPQAAQLPGPPAQPVRLDAQVAFNPFGTLNLGAPAALGAPIAPAAKPPSRKVKQVVAAPPPPPPPPAPMAPPLPFVAIGSLAGADVTGGQPVAFLQQREELLVVRAGQSLGNTYRVESITPQRIEFTYLPLMQRQSLPLAP